MPFPLLLGRGVSVSDISAALERYLFMSEMRQSPGSSRPRDPSQVLIVSIRKSRAADAMVIYSGLLVIYLREIVRLQDGNRGEKPGETC